MNTLQIIGRSSHQCANNRCHRPEVFTKWYNFLGSTLLRHWRTRSDFTYFDHPLK